MEQLIDTLCDKSDEQSSSDNFNSEDVDPLQGLENEYAEDIQPRYHSLNNVVFSEPLKNISNEEITNYMGKDEIMTIDNVIIQKESGRIYKKYHFNIDNVAQPRCPQENCTRTFSSTRLLRAHIRRVHCADKKHICEQCGRGFSEQYLLNRHVSCVHNEDKVDCPVCGVKLSCKSSVSRHLRSHSDARPHECHICHKTFARSSTKNTHIKLVHR